MGELPVMQREHERGRWTVPGKVRITDADAATLSTILTGDRVTPCSDAPEWLALRRVQRGGVTRTSGGYLDHGSPRADYLTTTLEQLTDAGLITLADPDPTGLSSTSLPPTGFTRLTELNTHRRAASRLRSRSPRSGARCQPLSSPEWSFPPDECPTTSVATSRR